MEKEIWKPIPHYEDLYEASNFGRIRSLKFGKVRILKQTKNTWGYLQVDLCKNRKKKSCKVHRLVWEAFNGNHIDEDKTNNFLFVNPDGSVDLQKSNLNLMTPKQNANWGTRNKRVAEKQSMCVLQFTLDWKFVGEWCSTMECGRNGFNQGNVCECCRNCFKREGNNIYKGYIWMYADDFLNSLPII